MAGQTINDRLLAARHSLSGQGLAKSVCKATTEEMIGPKKKHLDYLVHCTNEPNVSIPNLANLLIERSQNANWVVVYKALITVHHLLAYGNERFMQYLASSNSTFNLSNFLDKGGVQGTVGARIGYDMSPFIRRYAKYLNEKALSYRTVAFDFCKVKRGKEEGSLRTMNADKLLKTLPVLQSQLDGLLEFDCSANDLTNGVINMCFMLLFRDLIRLFACYNDGIINLLEKYFDMNKKQCRDALDLYKKFLVRMDRVGEFLKVAENVGIDKGDIPDLTKAPSSLLDALEQHLATLEGRKGSAANTPTQSASNQKNVKSGVSALSSTSSSFGTAAASTKFDSHPNGIDETIKAQALAEEEAAMNQYKSKIASPTSGSAALTNPFLSSPPATQTTAPIVDLFGSTDATKSTDQLTGGISSNSKPSDDLLQLGNPFADMFGAPTPSATVSSTGQQSSTATGANKIWMSNGFNGSVAPAGNASANAFVSDSNFSSVFGNTEPASNNYLQAAMDNPFLLDNDDITPTTQNNYNNNNAVLMQQQQQQQQQQQMHQDQILQQNQNQQESLSNQEILVSQQQEQLQGESQISSSVAGKVDDSGGSINAQSPAPTYSIAPQAVLQSSVTSPPLATKNAFDDLNDSIRVAMGGSQPSSKQTEDVTSSSSENVIQQGAGFGVGVVGVPPSHLQQQQFIMGMGYVGGGGGAVGVNVSASTSASGIGVGGYNAQQIFMTSSAHQQQMTTTVVTAGAFDALGDVLKPATSAVSNAGGIQTGNILNTGGNMQQQQHNMQQQQQQSQQPQSTGKILTGDLDSSLASLVDNLNINKAGSGKGMQWNSPKNTAKPGANWTPQPMAATTGVGYRPMAQGMTVSPAPSTLNHPFVHATYPVIPTYMQQGMPQMQPMMGAPVAPGGMPIMTAPGMMPMQGTAPVMPGMMGMQPTQVVAGQPTPMMMPTQSTSTTQQQQSTTQQQSSPAQQNGNKNVQLDPFGAL